MKKNDPNKKNAIKSLRSHDFKVGLARYFFIEKSVKRLKINVTGAEIKEKSELLVEKNGVCIELFRMIFEYLTCNGYNLSKPKRANTIWDAYIAFGLGQEFEGAACGKVGQLHLVTGDKKIAEAAKAASLGDYVMTLDDYLKKLEQDLSNYRT
ncbi:MAG: hypothetical protein HZA50_02500 [Planctomycetes bacterium]|nr:hypothetical protein [Planctomycetota bacterium]